MLSQFLSARNQSGKVKLGDLPRVMSQLKAFNGVLSEDEIKAILSESSSDLDEEIDFEFFLRVSIASTFDFTFFLTFSTLYFDGYLI